MVIAIEIQRLFRKKKHGMEIVALEIIRNLQQLDLQNKYIIFSKKDVDDDCIKPTPNFIINTTLRKTIYPLWEQFYLAKAIKKIKPTLLHCTSNTAPLFCKIPLIITIHDVIYMESINFSGSSYQNFGNLYRRFIVARVAKKAALIITVSTFEKKIIAQKLNISEEKIKVIYNGISDQFKVIANQNILDTFSKKYNLPKRFLLHLGNTAPKKNTIGVLLAYKIYIETVADPLPLVFTDCANNYIFDLIKKIDALEILKHIQILPYVPYNTIHCLYNLATIFLYPSHRESFGLPVIEAMACGLPVITSNTSALPEIAGDAACLIDPTKPVEIFEQILFLLSDEVKYQEIKEKGFQNAARFSWKKSAEKTLQVYNEIANGIN